MLIKEEYNFCVLSHPKGYGVCGIVFKENFKLFPCSKITWQIYGDLKLRHQGGFDIALVVAALKKE